MRKTQARKCWDQLRRSAGGMARLDELFALVEDIADQATDGREEDTEPLAVLGAALKLYADHEHEQRVQFLGEFFEWVAGPMFRDAGQARPRKAV